VAFENLTVPGFELDGKLLVLSVFNCEN